MSKAVLFVVLGAAVVAAVLLLLPRDGNEAALPGSSLDTAPNIMLVGIDGLDWDRVNRLADEGRMPNIAGMRRDGASGILMSIPPFVSPTIWTSIATGKVSDKHGIEGFIVNVPAEGETAPTTSNMRRARAVWQILSAAERRVGVVGWLVTYPADTVNGYLVSSHATLALCADESSRAPNQTDEWLAKGVYPPELWHEVKDNSLSENDISDSVLEKLLAGPLSVARAEEPVRVKSLARFCAFDITSLELARHFEAEMPSNFTTVYLRGTDMASHFFWRFMEPETWSKKLSEEAIKTLSPVVDRYYAMADSILGEMMALADENTVVMVCSDHGFAGHRGYTGFEGDVAVGVQMHRAEGVLFAAGPGIKAGGRVEGATVLDITPTILALSGLPVARDMDGRPLSEMLEAPFLNRFPVDYIETYEVERAGDGDEAPIESPVDEEIKEMLRSLGYID